MSTRSIGLRGSRRPVSAVAMGVALGTSAGIHAFMIGAHLADWWLSGAFFIAATVAQVTCAYLVLVSGGQHATLAGVIVSGVLVSVWAVSRTMGIPFGPGAGAPEPTSELDIVATATEILVIGVFVWRLRTSRMPTTRRPPRLLSLAIVSLTFGVGSATALVLPAHSHSHGDSPVGSYGHKATQSDRDPHSLSARSVAELQVHTHDGQSAGHDHP